MRTPFYDAIRKGASDCKTVVFALRYPPVYGVCCSPTQDGAKQYKPEPLYLHFQIPIADADGTIANIFSSHPSQSRDFAGVGDWIPRYTPAQGDNFLGIDRTRDPYRLAGLRIETNGMAFRESLMFSIQQNYREGGSANTFYMPGWAGNEDFKVNGSCGNVWCKFDDTLCGNDAFLIQDDTWCAYNEDGKLALGCEAPGYNARVMGLDYARR